jgi:cellulose synthase/poly-beta-1,6-N-acetylglucosamine synthase-like glycosyltransferase
MVETSIVIPVVEINDYIRESISRILAMNYKNFEILIFSDEESGEVFQKTRIIATGKIGPAEKRDLSIRYAKGKILAFLDDDAFPAPDWLTKAVGHFNDENVYAVGGPAITPKGDSFWQRVSGAVFITKVGGGNPERYWPVGSSHEVDDWPSVNLIIRKDIFAKVGGFKSKYWPGEDTILCMDIIEAGGKIIYDPDVIVCHHRRRGFIRHLKQIGSYGLHRGFFLKRYGGNSLKLKYFIPSLFFLYVLFITVFIGFGKPSGSLIFIFFSPYLIALAYGFLDICRKEKNIFISLFAIFYIVCSHLWYGIRFLQGFLFKRYLVSKLRIR